MHNFTSDHLLLYIYGELADNEVLSLQNALATDWTLQEKYKALQLALKQLNKLEPVPPVSRQTNDAILQYAYKKIGEKVS
jgi:hypothetical protein